MKKALTANDAPSFIDGRMGERSHRDGEGSVEEDGLGEERYDQEGREEWL